MSNEINQRAREFLAKKLPWRKVKSLEYKSIAHEYIVRRECKREFDQLSKIIKEHGVYRSWRGKRFKYFTWRGMIYWQLWLIINRTYVAALHHGGYPGKKDQQRIFKRFWGGEE